MMLMRARLRRTIIGELACCGLRFHSPLRLGLTDALTPGALVVAALASALASTLVAPPWLARLLFGPPPSR